MASRMRPGPSAETTARQTAVGATPSAALPNAAKPDAVATASRPAPPAATHQDHIYATLRQWVTVGRFLPGERLKIRTVAAQLGVGQMVHGERRLVSIDSGCATSLSLVGGIRDDQVDVVLGAAQRLEILHHVSRIGLARHHRCHHEGGVDDLAIAELLEEEIGRAHV